MAGEIADHNFEVDYTQGVWARSDSLKGLVTRLGILVVLLLPQPHVVQGQQRPSVSELLRVAEAAQAAISKLQSDVAR
jgi:hypothetical protein